MTKLSLTILISLMAALLISSPALSSGRNAHHSTVLALNNGHFVVTQSRSHPQSRLSRQAYIKRQIEGRRTQLSSVPINRRSWNSDDDEPSFGGTSGIRPLYQERLAREAYITRSARGGCKIGFEGRRCQISPGDDESVPIDQPGRDSFIPVSVEQGANPTNRFQQQDDGREEILILFKEQR